MWTLWCCWSKKWTYSYICKTMSYSFWWVGLKLRQWVYLFGPTRIIVFQHVPCSSMRFRTLVGTLFSLSHSSGFFWVAFVVRQHTLPCWGTNIIMVCRLHAVWLNLVCGQMVCFNGHPLGCQEMPREAEWSFHLCVCISHRLHASTKVSAFICLCVACDMTWDSSLWETVIPSRKTLQSKATHTHSHTYTHAEHSRTAPPPPLFSSSSSTTTTRCISRSPSHSFILPPPPDDDLSASRAQRAAFRHCDLICGASELSYFEGECALIHWNAL